MVYSSGAVLTVFSSQYHASFILLHRPLALYEFSKSDVSREVNQTMESLAAISRSVCMEHSFRMTHLFTRQMQRFEPIRTPQTQLQHLGTAIAALISAVAISKDPQQRLRQLQSLHALGDFVRKISPTYRCAEIISDVLETILKEPGWELNQTLDISDHQLGDITATPERLSVRGTSFGETSKTRPQQLTPGSMTNLSSQLDFGRCYPQSPELTFLTSLAPAPTTSAQQRPSQPPQQVELQDDLDQTAFAPLAGWPMPSFNTSNGLGSFYTQDGFNGTDADFDMMY